MHLYLPELMILIDLALQPFLTFRYGPRPLSVMT